ncbi:MAG TPA: SDR family NAD(P)-dependent oxidoreductase [Bacillota bacterium]|nr:SDR family NAD(P)-dependent oxidoreductase [Bacillota bacterium]
MNVVVVGASRGLGYSLVEKFSQEGHRVVAGVRDIEDQRLKDLMQTYRGIKIMHMDVIDEESMKAAGDQLGKDGFSIDLLIHNAGIILAGDVDHDLPGISIGDFRKTLDVNTTGTVIAVKYLLPLVNKDGSGQVFLITSEAGSMTHSGSTMAAYSISKAAQNKTAFVLKAALEDRYRVLAIHPGRMKTDMGGDHSEIEPEESAEGIYKLATGIKKIKEGSSIFINYKGEEMVI